MPLDPSQYADNRELATILWVVALVAVALLVPPMRKALLEVLRHLRKWKVWLPMFVYAGYLVALIYVGYHLNIWTWGLLAATLIWFFVSGLTSLASAITDATKAPGHFRKYFLELVGLTILLEFFINIRPFPLLGELLLVPLITILAMAQSLPRSPDTAAGARLASAVLGYIALALLIWTVISVANNPEVPLGDLLRSFLLPLWLAVATLPVVFVGALLASYELLFSRMRARTGARSIPFAVRLGLLSSLKADFYAIGRFAGQRGHEAMRASTFRAARREVDQYRADEARKEAEQREARERLVEMAGITGTDEHGRQLDRREFSETKQSLVYLHMCMMGHYRQRGHYRSDILSVLGDFEKKGLPEPHGIELKVRQDGQAWFARRTTPSGFCFGIGANGAPGSQWVYAGHTLPSGFPSQGEGWTDYLSETPLEWRTEPATSA